MLFSKYTKIHINYLRVHPETHKSETEIPS